MTSNRSHDISPPVLTGEGGKLMDGWLMLTRCREKKIKMRVIKKPMKNLRSRRQHQF